MSNKIQYLSREKRDELENEFKQLKNIKIPTIAKRIDEAKQMGDLSENAEYHSAREDMAWAQSRVKEIQDILDNAQIIKNVGTSDMVSIGSNIVVESSGIKKEFTIVGPQEADPIKGKISHESPLGAAFLGHRATEIVKIKTPSGSQEYKIIEIKRYEWW